MKNLKFGLERYDTDEITSIELIKDTIIGIKFGKGGYHTFSYGMDADEAKRDYEKLIRDYNEAIRKRQSGEEAKERAENERRRQEDLNNFYGIDDDEFHSEISKQKDSSDDKKEISQPTLF